MKRATTRVPGVDRRQDEQRLEHDREVVPVGESARDGPHHRQPGEDLGHAHREANGTAGLGGELHADVLLEAGQIDGGQAEVLEDLGGGVDGEVIGGV